MFIFFFLASFFTACRALSKAGDCVVVGVGGFVAAPVAIAAKFMRKPLVFINVDAVPGKANRFLARLASKIFVQFESTKDKFGRGNFEVIACGCPLREEFLAQASEDIAAGLNLAKDKKVLLITGASSGAQNLNIAMEVIMPKLAAYKDSWQVVHISGVGKSARLQDAYNSHGITACVLEYCDKMPQLLNAASLTIARCGAVSVAEFITTATPAICLPYPYHADNHQRLNAIEMENLGGAIIVEDHKDNHTQTAQELWQAFQSLVCDETILNNMKASLQQAPTADAAVKIADHITAI